MSKNFTISDSDLRGILPKVRKGGNNQYITNCPYCGKDSHFYINITTQLHDCKKCGEEGNIIKLLKFLGKLDLLGDFKSIKRGHVKLLDEFDNGLVDDEIDLNPKKRKLPLGFKRQERDDYWMSRGFTEFDFKKYEIGYTDLESSYENYSIIAIKEDNNNVGFLARIRLSKEQIKSKEKKSGKQIARFRNDKGAKFSNLLMGFDELTSETKSVILLEGFPDKVTLDRILKLDEQEQLKCCCTFGKKISKNQVLKLLSKGIEKIILIFDYDAIKEMKKQGAILQEYFDVLIGFTMSKDINESTETEVLEIFSNLKTVSEFKRTTVKTL